VDHVREAPELTAIWGWHRIGPTVQDLTMSQINPRNYQLGLAFNDADLRKPDHDKIMLWLNDWVKEPANLRHFLPSSYSRSIAYRNRFDGEAEALLLTLGHHQQQLLRRDIGEVPRERATDYGGAWPDEPPFKTELVRSSWERMLKSDRGSLVGFCDLHCVYEVWHNLTKAIIQYYKICPTDEPGPLCREWKIEKSGAIEEVYRSGPGNYEIYFEVKSEIKSIGELIRQLQLYRSSSTFHESLPRARLVVVAPPHNGAASVCHENGFDLLEYRPD
jgi:hypothetical protein